MRGGDCNSAIGPPEHHISYSDAENAVNVMTRTISNTRRAITIAEMILSITIMTIVMGATTGAMQMIMLQGNKKQFEEKTRAESAIGLHQLRSDIGFAKSVSVMSDKIIEFTAPDVDGDGSDDVIQYEWSGTAGDPVVCAVNGVPEFEPISDVTDFSMMYDLDVTQTDTAGDTTQSAPARLLKVTDGLGFVGQIVRSTTPIAQIIVPDLPADATSWSIESVEFRAKANTASIGRLIPVIRDVLPTGEPGLLVLESGTPVTDTDLVDGEYTWIRRTFSQVTGLDPTAKAAFCLYAQQPFKYSDVQCVTGPADGDSMLATSVTGGFFWTLDPNASMMISVVGTYEMTVAGGSVSQGFVKSVVFSVTVNQQATDRTYRTAGRSMNKATFSGMDLTNVPLVTSP